MLLFQPNTMTGTPTAFHRNADDLLVVILAVQDASYRFIADGDMAARLETLLFRYRTRLRTITLTVQYGANGLTIEDFSIITT